MIHAERQRLAVDARDAARVAHVVDVQGVVSDEGCDGSGAGHLVLEGLVAPHRVVTVEETLKETPHSVSCTV